MILSTIENIVKKSLFLVLGSFLFLMRPNNMERVVSFLFIRYLNYSKKNKALQKEATSLQDENALLVKQLNLPLHPEIPPENKKNLSVHPKQTATGPHPIHPMRL
ncbi:MAG: hypothetical protein AAGI66_02675 [Cyanobacteria bacterium P01_H01_bin.74]